MRMIDRTTQFKKDQKRERKGQHQLTVDAEVGAIVQKLAEDLPLEEKHRDHALSGDLKGCRDCHVKSDLVLIYSKPDDETLQLIRLGSHSELGW